MLSYKKLNKPKVLAVILVASNCTKDPSYLKHKTSIYHRHQKDQDVKE